MRPSKALVVVAVLAGCSAQEQDRTWGAWTSCDAAAVQGHPATRTWCGSEWRTWHAPGKAASAGRVVDGRHLPAHTMWWPDGSIASRQVGRDVYVYEIGQLAADGDPEAATAKTVGTGVVDEQGRLALGCPDKTATHEAKEESGHRRWWCGTEDQPHGRLVSYYPDGSVESVQTYINGVRHGPFEAFHVGGPREPGPEESVGPVWIRGDYAAGKKHGPWLTFSKEGQVFQEAVEPEWKDHKAVDTWLTASVSADL